MPSAASSPLNSPVILLDVNMPGMDGFETAQLIRQRKSSEHTPIIFVTAYSDEVFHVPAVYSLGAVDYILQPVVPEILRSKVSVFVDLYRKNPPHHGASPVAAPGAPANSKKLASASVAINGAQSMVRTLQIITDSGARRHRPATKPSRCCCSTPTPAARPRKPAPSAPSPINIPTWRGPAPWTLDSVATSVVATTPGPHAPTPTPTPRTSRLPARQSARGRKRKSPPVLGLLAATPRRPRRPEPSGVIYLSDKNRRRLHCR